MYILVKTTVFPQNRNKFRMSTCTTSVQHCTGCSNQGSKARNVKKTKNKKKRHPSGNREMVLPLLADDIIIYIKNVTKFDTKLLELISVAHSHSTR